jgi:protein-S-isoprenylcysteine O-methyltransferase Ste14
VNWILGHCFFAILISVGIGAFGPSTWRLRRIIAAYILVNVFAVAQNAISELASDSAVPGNAPLDVADAIWKAVSTAVFYSLLLQPIYLAITCVITGVVIGVVDSCRTPDARTDRNLPGRTTVSLWNLLGAIYFIAVVVVMCRHALLESRKIDPSVCEGEWVRDLSRSNGSREETSLEHCLSASGTLRVLDASATVKEFVLQFPTEFVSLGRFEVRENSNTKITFAHVTKGYVFVVEFSGRDAITIFDPQLDATTPLRRR